MAGNTISVARLLELRVPVAWQEAVEVARAAAVQANARSLRITVDDCYLSTDGTVDLATDGSDRIGEPLTDLQLLNRLLAGRSAPPELQQLLATADDALASFPSENDSASPRPLSLEWFTRASPETEIAGLAMRAVEADRAAVRKPTVEIERVRAEVIELPVRRRRRSLSDYLTPLLPSRRTMAGAVALGGIAVMGVLAWSWVSGERPSAAARVEEVSGVVADATTVGEGAVPVDEAPAAAAPAPVGPPPANATGAPPEPVRTASSAPRRAAATSGAASVTPAPAPPPARASSVPRASTAVAPPVVPDPVMVVSPEPPSVPARRPSTVTLPADERRSTAPPPVSAPTPSNRATSRSAAVPVPLHEIRIYSDQDAEVDPPVPVRPQLPSERKADSDAGDSFIEVVVDERGQVLTVRLHSSDVSFNDRMIVSAAKAWQFRPALKDGQPVRYRLRMPVNQ